MPRNQDVWMRRCFREKGLLLLVFDSEKIEYVKNAQKRLPCLKWKRNKITELIRNLKKLAKRTRKKLCKDQDSETGGVQQCLRKNLSQVSEKCKKQLERQDIEDANDLRLQLPVYRACLADKQKFCKDIPAGEGRALQCLMENHMKKGFSQECNQEIVKLLFKRIKNIKLDPQLTKVCGKDINITCGFNILDGEFKEDEVLKCLQDKKDNLIGAHCKEYIHNLEVEEFADIQLNVPLAEACHDDRKQYCPQVPPGSARVISCLQEHRQDLSATCKATLFDQEVSMAEDIDFKYPMKQACQLEISKFCQDVPSGHARIVRCLQENMDKEGFTMECKEEVQKDEQRSSMDYRLNYRLESACEKDTKALCSDACTQSESSTNCGGRVLRCLTEKLDDIKQSECQKEVMYFIKMEITDFRNDLTLAEECRNDVDKFCVNVEKGVGKVHRCLRDHLKDLSETCRDEEMKLMQLQSRDVRLQPTLMKACQSEMYMFCQKVQPGGGRVFRCLQRSLGESQFSAECAQEVMARGELMQTDYKFDYGLKTNCKEDVGSFCKEAVSGPHKAANVLKCLINNYASLQEGCAREISRAVRMALWTYKPNGVITGVCDADVNATCANVADNSRKKAFGIGVIGRCLSKQAASGATFQQDECKNLVLMTVPQDVDSMYGSVDTVSIVQKLQEFEQQLGSEGRLVQQGRITGFSSIAFGGWLLLGMLVALIGVIFAMIMVGVRNIFSKTIVMKPGQFKDGAV
eukprot:TRINITY_DN5227_c0_g2_i3.p1 TRINITY_DN5227_c0_g2~~TRINITY_DN5227_c0_g2_i3.p1  ORF type:complete len:747 (-),score=90.56 TRINITY_DN5227_c0_g2_i3:695-2935(-)